MRYVRSLAVVFAASLAAGCSGGGSPAAPVQRPAPAAPVTTAGTRVDATLQFTIPSRASSSARRGSAARAPRYISPGTLGAIVTATSTDVPANNVTLGLGVGSDIACAPSASGSACQVLVPLFADTYVVRVALYDTSEDGHAGAPVGNLLSVDTENETIVLGALNTITNVLLHAQIASFSVPSDIATVGGTPFASPGPVVTVAPLDHGGFAVDTYANATTYANGPFAVTAADLGDITGCTPTCFNASNDLGASPTTIAKAADTSLTLSYTGGGGPGTAIEAYVPNQIVLSGTRPYAGSLTISGGGVPQATSYALPLFAYPQSLLVTGGTSFVWAAQYALPPGAAANGSYGAYFSTPGTSTCTNPQGQIVAGIGTLTYFPGYGSVFPISAGVRGTCTLTLTDGGSPAHTVSVPVTVGPPSSTLSVPCAGNVGQPTGALRPGRRTAAAAASSTPVLVQSATGFGQVALPQSVTAGDTLVFVVADVPSTPEVDPSFTEFPAATDGYGFVFTSTVSQTKPSGAITTSAGCSASMWLGEFSGTSASAISAANAAAVTTSTATTSTIVPNAAGGLVITSFVGNTDATVGPASAGYTAFGVTGPGSMIEVQLATSPTTDTTDPVGNTFAGVTDASGHAEIFQIPPASFGATTTARVRTP